MFAMENIENMNVARSIETRIFEQWVLFIISVFKSKKRFIKIIKSNDAESQIPG